MALSVSVPMVVRNIPQVEMDWVEDGQDLFTHMPAHETKIAYTNNLDVDVWVCERSGAIHKLAPRHGKERVFGVKISRKFHSSTTVSYDLGEMVENKIGALRPDVSMRAMAESYNPIFRSMAGMGVSKDIVFTLNKRRIEERGGVVYHEASDLVVAMTREQAVHPGSPQARLANIREGIIEPEGFPTSGHLRFSISIIDNERVYGDKYVNMGGVVHLAKAVQSDRFPSGVYVSRDGVANDAGQSSKPTVTRYKFEEVSESGIGFYDSREAAESMGNFEKAAEQKAAQIKAETTVLKGVLDKESLETKLHTSRELTDLERRSLERKDRYEDRSHRRKDSSEEMKYIFAAIAGFFGLLAVILR